MRVAQELRGAGGSRRILERGAAHLQDEARFSKHFTTLPHPVAPSRFQ
jgi:hypothetical protein